MKPLKDVPLLIEITVNDKYKTYQTRKEQNTIKCDDTFNMIFMKLNFHNIYFYFKTHFFSYLCSKKCRD